MGRANNSSIDENNGMKIAVLGKQRALNEQAKFSAKDQENENIVNSNKAKIKNNSAQAKAKAKAKKAKAKASRKANKKK